MQQHINTFQVEMKNILENSISFKQPQSRKGGCQLCNSTQDFPVYPNERLHMKEAVFAGYDR